MVVEDEPTLRRALCRFLRRRGCVVTSAADGIEGLTALRGREFDLVVTDLRMPGCDGLELWRSAVALRPELRGRFLFCSAESLPAALAEAAVSERFLEKPFECEQLWEEVSAGRTPPPIAS